MTVSGKVIEKPSHAYMTNAEFRVRPGGRARVLEERRKNVHAFVVGEVVTTDQDEMPGISNDAVKVKYDPYVAGDFFIVDTGEVIKRAREVWLTPTGVFARE